MGSRLYSPWLCRPPHPAVSSCHHLSLGWLPFYILPECQLNIRYRVDLCGPHLYYSKKLSCCCDSRLHCVRRTGIAVDNMNIYLFTLSNWSLLGPGLWSRDTFLYFGMRFGEFCSACWRRTIIYHSYHFASWSRCNAYVVYLATWYWSEPGSDGQITNQFHHNVNFWKCSVYIITIESRKNHNCFAYVHNCQF